MPVGTGGAVKAMLNKELADLNTEIILSNTYHLFLRPGMEIIESFGSLHKFISWEHAILTDSGGFQIFSLGKNSKVTDQGVEFKSHIDGSKIFFSPEDVVRIQNTLDSDIQMVLDYFAGYPATTKEDENALRITDHWAGRARDEFLKTPGNNAQFGIIQGGLHMALREESLEGLKKKNFEGYAVGGLSVGESRKEFDRVISFILPKMPFEKPRYLMGCGNPTEILFAVEQGVDMFDCVLPTRVARNGALFTRRGRISIKNSRYKHDNQPVDDTCNCYTCKNFSRSYLRHLFISKEINSAILNTIHNLHFYLDFMREIRYSISISSFLEFKRDFLAIYNKEGVLS
jgi:queuine tRNA-ribosyltransferase